MNTKTSYLTALVVIPPFTTWGSISPARVFTL